jgi:transporter family protein
MQDLILARASRIIGALRVSFWYLFVSVIMFIGISIILFTKMPVNTYTVSLILLSGAFSAIGITSFTKGLSVGNISIVAPIASEWGLVAAILGTVFLGEVLGPLQFLFIAMILIGTFLASVPSEGMKRGKKLHSGVPYAVSALIGWGVYFFILAILVGQIGWFDTSFLPILATVVFLFAYARISHSRLKPVKPAFYDVLAMAALLVISLMAYNAALLFTYVNIVAPISSSAVAITVLFAFILFKERLSARQLIGIAMIIAGIVALAA